MRRNQWLAAAVLVGVVGAAAVEIAARLEQRQEQQRFALLDRYCTECHNAAELAGDMSFDGLTLAAG